MNFGEALELLKNGERVCRKGWNGEGMWLVLVPGSPLVTFTKGTPYHAVGIRKQTNIDPHIDMFTAKGSMQPGWLASQTDMLAEDWEMCGLT